MYARFLHRRRHERKYTTRQIVEKCKITVHNDSNFVELISKFSRFFFAHPLIVTEVTARVGFVLFCFFFLQSSALIISSTNFEDDEQRIRETYRRCCRRSTQPTKCDRRNVARLLTPPRFDSIVELASLQKKDAGAVENTAVSGILYVFL